MRSNSRQKQRVWFSKITKDSSSIDPMITYSKPIMKRFTVSATAGLPKEIAAYKALHTYAPNTTITNDAGCEMSLTYTVDTQKYVDKKIAAVSAAMIGG